MTDARRAVALRSDALQLDALRSGALRIEVLRAEALVTRALSAAAVLLSLALVACTSLSGTDANSGSAFSREAQRVREAVEGLIAADNRGDLEGVVTRYTQNVVLAPPAGPPIEGRESVRSHYRTLFERDQLALRVQIAETSVMRDTASVRGRTTGRRTPRAGGESVAINDDFVADLALETDGRWRITRLRWWPSSSPPPR